MATARELRQHAAELFAIAMDARDKGDDELAKLITARVKLAASKRYRPNSWN
jgi:hypothetical protein